MIDHSGRWAWAEIDLDAVEHNVKVMRSVVAPANVWAVVKADGYGHGAVRVAARAVEAGAAGLCVALVAEGVELRNAGIEAPILVLSEQPVELIDALIDHRLVPTVYTHRYADALAAAVPKGDTGYPIHVKIDTGMQRVGVPDAYAVELMRYIASLAPTLSISGVYSHLACADDPISPANDLQLDRFERVLDQLDAAGLRPAHVHAANSAGGLAIPRSRHSLVRAGISLYGVSPGAGVDHLVADFRPVMSLRARVSYIKRVEAGSHISYAWRHRFEHDTAVVTIPLGYADGVPRRMATLADRPGADVLIGGRRCPIVGVVTMDQIMVDIGDADVSIGDEVVLIGTQGDETIRAEDWADQLGTIGYEIVCAISSRVPRVVRLGTVRHSIDG